MEQNIEIKSKDKESAIVRALKILEASPEHVVKVIEKQKSVSFFGLYSKEGIYEIFIDKSQKKKDSVIEARENTNKKSEKNSEKKFEKKLDKNSEKKPEKSFDKRQDRNNTGNSTDKRFEEKNIAREPIVFSEDKDKEILEKIAEFLSHMNLDLTAEITEKDGRLFTVNLSGKDNAIIIGKKGKTLTNFEYLINTIIRDVRIIIDVEGFKDKRSDTLRELGRKVAEKTLATGKTTRLNPMPPKERKIIHEVINQYEGLDTFSEGVDPKRYIVVKKKK
ncbi:MAG: protein jag [Fusobacteriaceae bacterium]